jgi:hypothetical protein
MLIGRLDVIVDKTGDIQVCENDDVPSLWPAMPEVNPIVETYLDALEDQVGPIYTAELFHYRHIVAGRMTVDRPPIPKVVREDLWEKEARKVGIAKTGKNRELNYLLAQDADLSRFYAHNEDHWRGDYNDPLNETDIPPWRKTALVVRAYRDAPGFEWHMNTYGERSITMAWERDSKFPLVAEGLGALAANLEVAAEFGRQWQADYPEALLVFKALHGARTEGVGIFSARGTKPRGVSSVSQIKRKFGEAADLPIVVQPYKEPDSLARAGVEFIGNGDEDDAALDYTDRQMIRSVEHIGRKHGAPGERVIHGMENNFRLLFRSFVIYLPKEGRLLHVGGMWQATDGRIVHGGSHSVSGPLYIEGLMGHPKHKRHAYLNEMEELVRQYDKSSKATDRLQTP